METRVIRTLATVYIMRLGPRVLCSLDPNWLAAFSILTESADPVKVLTAAQVNYSFHILAVGRNGHAEAASTHNVYPHVIFQPKLSEIAPAQLFHAIYYARMPVEGLGSEASIAPH